MKICRIADRKEGKLVSPYELNHKFVDGVEFKLCNHCTEWFPMNDEHFYKNKSSPDSFNPYCKECTKLRLKRWRKENPEKQINIDFVRRTNNPEYFKKKRRNYYENNKEREREYYKKWINENKDRLPSYRNNSRKHDITDHEWLACLEFFNYECAYCGLSEVEQVKKFNHQFHKDHVYSDGSNYVDNCVPSCASCNTSKSDTNFNDWYNESNPNYTKRRLNKIVKWMTKECLKALNLL